MAEQEQNNQEKATGDGQQGQFSIQKIYLKDVSFEAPNSPQIFQAQWKPSVNVDIGNAVTPLSNEIFNVALTVTVTVSQDDKTIYLAEIQQAGIFQISGVSQEVLERTLATACPNILFPFAREAVAELISRGGFPQMLLAPVNFEVLYLQQQQQQGKQQAGDTKH